MKLWFPSPTSGSIEENASLLSQILYQHQCLFVSVLIALYKAGYNVISDVVY